MSSRLERFLLPVFAVSGFAGLVYQTVWSHYLGLSLGHAAYAQALVLAVFMGGMAIGAWLASRYWRGARWMLFAYAWVELVIGVGGLLFHPAFLGFEGASQQWVLPHLGDSAAATYQWIGSSLLILPQSVLLGATFPLICGVLVADGDDRGGRTLGGMYFSNSFGAAVGALVATYLLLPKIGMDGALRVAGVLNILVGIVAFLLAGKLRATQETAPKPRGDGKRLPKGLSAQVLAAAAITGATSFVYEIVWVRMLNQTLGSTVHSFELMLATFIFGLACGGLLVRWRGEKIRDATAAAGIVQVLMGVAGLLSAVAFAQSFNGMAWLMAHIPRTEDGYVLFDLGSAALAMSVMFPAAFLAGTTLPLLTMVLLRAGADGSSIGRTYAANTMGAIAGVMLALHVLVPAIGLHLSLVVAALGDVLLGLGLLGLSRPRRKLAIAWSVLGSVVALVVCLTAGSASPAALLSGVYRTGVIGHAPEESIAFLRDGKTSTVGVKYFGDTNTTIFNNGKPDAGMTRDLRHQPQVDELTMILLGAMPLVAHPQPSDIAVIGWGSGLSTHTLLGSPVLRRVDTIEIEPLVHEAARLFGSRVQRAYSDPRSRVHFEDARTWFATGNRKYDAIVSEPPNPWVNGVASLFTVEFYRRARASLRTDGILVQWVHLYDMSDAMLATQLAALLQVFPDTDAYVSDEVDLILVARTNPERHFNLSRLDVPGLREEVARVGLAGKLDFRRIRLAGPNLLAAYVHRSGARVHSDFLPEVALNGPKARFLGQSALYLRKVSEGWLPIGEMLDGIKPLTVAEEQAASEAAPRPSRTRAWEVMSSLERRLPTSGIRQTDPQLAGLLEQLFELSARPMTPRDIRRWTTMLSYAAEAGSGQLASEDLQASWIKPGWLPGTQPPVVGRVLAAYRALAQRDARQMQELALGLLQDRSLPIAPRCRQQLLLIAMLGAAVNGGPRAVFGVRARAGSVENVDSELADREQLLLAWAQAMRRRHAG